MVAAAIVGTGLATAAVGAYSADKAAGKQADAANNAAGNQMAMYAQNRADLGPYRALGTGSIPALIKAMGYTPSFDGNGNVIGLAKDASSPLNQSFDFNPSNLENYPGYQFALKQGLQGVNASAAARGLGVSGADIRGAADYATGLASSTYGQAYDQALTKFNTNYGVAANNANRLYQLMSTGQNSATQTANMGATATNNAGQLSTSGAAASAAGIVGGANAITGSIGQGMNYWQMNQLVNAINNSSGSTAGGGGTGVGTFYGLKQ